MNLSKFNRTQGLGLTLITVALASFLLPASWVAAYWDTTFQEEYNGYDIYFIPAPNVYAIDTGGEPTEWTYMSDIQGARNKIDLWNDGPIEVETYRDFTVYQLPGYTIFYAEQGETRSITWDSVENLKEYIDGEYYPTLVYTIHSGDDDYEIFRKGYITPVYWGELDGYKTPEFKDLESAKVFVRNRIEELTPGTDPTETAGNDPETPVQEDPISGSTYPEDTSETVGALLLQQRTMISAVFGITGTGCLIYGTGRRDEE